MSRSRDRAGSIKARSALCLATLLAVFAAWCLPARADLAPPSFWFSGTKLIFAHPEPKAGDIAVASDDPGLVRFLAKLGATLSYAPGQKYAVVTSADHRTVSFALGDTRFEVDGTTETAPFAAYASGSAVSLPLLTLAKALYVTPVDDGEETVLQPQIGGLDVKSEGRVTTATFHGATKLRFKRLSGPGDEKLEVAFSGTATTLDPERTVGMGALRHISIGLDGSARSPRTVVDFDLAPGTLRVLGPSDAPNAIVFAFAPAGVTLGGTGIPSAGDASLALAPLALPSLAKLPSGRDGHRPWQAPPAPVPPPVAVAARTPLPTPAPTSPDLESPAPFASPAPSPAPPAQVVSVTTTPVDEGFDVQLGITGDLAFEWHRLPDNRWFVDLKNAQLATSPLDEPVDSPAVRSLRVKAVGTADAPAVRLALTLPSPRLVDVAAVKGGITVHVDALDDLAAARAGAGTLAGGTLVAAAAATPLPQRLDQAPPVDDSMWKFSPAPSAKMNPRLIVIDPGHGGSDTGAMHNGLVEKNLTLDISERLKSVLLARGWQVKLTRETDVDVYAPNDSAHDELQARCDVANNNGARLFISVHINSFTSSGLNGTTVYYYKSSDYGLARAVHERLASSLPTNDDGVQKANFYVIHHTAAPAILVETAFLSNPEDAAYLRSPGFLQKVAVGIADGVGKYSPPGPPALGSANDDTDNGY
jgi:N-acetylmuramoyl-L-alanine amidase CwlD